VSTPLSGVPVAEHLMYGPPSSLEAAFIRYPIVVVSTTQTVPFDLYKLPLTLSLAEVKTVLSALAA